MENKYFTPDIEDLYVGYKLEIKGKHDTNWQPVVLGKDAIWHKFTNLENLGQVMEQLRVPYLTKEQIEGEEWKYLSEGYAEHQAFYKDDFQMSCFYDKHLLKIIKKESSKTIVLYQGSCRCINDLKKIIKLLEI